MDGHYSTLVGEGDVDIVSQVTRHGDSNHLSTSEIEAIKVVELDAGCKYDIGTEALNLSKLSSEEVIRAVEVTTGVVIRKTKLLRSDVLAIAEGCNHLREIAAGISDGDALNQAVCGLMTALDNIEL